MLFKKNGQIFAIVLTECLQINLGQNTEFLETLQHIIGPGLHNLFDANFNVNVMDSTSLVNQIINEF